MKILDSSSPEMRAIQRVSSINDEIRRLCGTTGLDQAHAELLLTTELKERIEWVDTLQSLEQAFDERAAIFEAVKEKMQAHNSGFQKFQLLPRELRYKIWKFSMEAHLRPRVHCVERKGGRWISNHEISPLLHACVESRVTYLFASDTSFMFETYVNLDLDTIYLPFLRAFKIPSAETTIAEIEEMERQNASSCEEFSSFLEDESTVKIHRLALDSNAFLYMPSNDWFSELHQLMRDTMPLWEETYIVINDDRSPNDVWLDTGAGFRELSSRRKRSAHCAYVRGYTRTLLTHNYYSRDPSSETGLLEPMSFRFVSIKETEDFESGRRMLTQAGRSEIMGLRTEASALELRSHLLKTYTRVRDGI